MLKEKTIGVVVPSYNEETQIRKVIDTMPDFVDRIVIVNDASTDETRKIVLEAIKSDRATPSKVKGEEGDIEPDDYNMADQLLKDLRMQEAKLYTPHEVVNKDPENSRIILIDHKENASVGAAIATGYKWCRDNRIDCTAVMAGDGQMDPSELRSICIPVVEEEVDYSKGNRLRHKSASIVVPTSRYFGNSVLSLLTKIASGYWHVSDTQTGYTAISLQALESIPLHKIYKSYGCPNDILVKLNITSFRITEIDIKPVYNVGEKSKMRVFKVIPKISWLLCKSFFRRLYSKYLLRDFHPLFLLYHLGFILLFINTPFAIQGVLSLASGFTIPLQYLMIFIFLTISGLQSLFFAMWMDMMDNERLQV